MSFFTALGNYLGSQAQARRAAAQQASQNAYQQNQMGLERQRFGLEKSQADEQKRYNDAALAQIANQNAQATRNRQFESGLTLPHGWSKLKPEEQYNYLNVRYSKALQAGDSATAKATLDQMNSIPRAGNTFANTEYTTQGKLPLAQAQTAWWKQKHSEVMAALQARMRAADASTQARMAAAGLAARTRLQAAGMNNDEREYVATMTALNAANHLDSTQAFNEAMAQYKQASSQWAAQQKQYFSTGQAPPGFDPSTPPTPQQFTVNIPAMNAQPSVVVVPITMPDGTKREIPVVQPRGPSAAPPATRDADPQKIKAAANLVKQARSEHPDWSDEQILRDAVQGGAPEDLVRAGIKAAGPHKKQPSPPPLPIGGGNWFLH